MPAQRFTLIVLILTSLLFLTTPPVLSRLITLPQPTPTPTLAPPTATPLPTATPDPFADIPTATAVHHRAPNNTLPTPPPLPVSKISHVAPQRHFRQTTFLLAPTPPADADLPLVGLPVEGRLTQGFGCSMYQTGHRSETCPATTPWFHDGLDLAAPVGTPVRAALTGTVTFAGVDGRGPRCGPQPGYGLGLVIETADGWHALYAHLDEIFVTLDQPVRPETVIGTVGTTGCAAGAHLHFGLKQADRLVDPLRGAGAQGSAEAEESLFSSASLPPCAPGNCRWYGTWLKD